MRTLPLLAALLVASPAVAQYSLPDAVKAGAQDLAARKARQAAAEKAAAQAKAKKIIVDEPFSALVERLIQDGDQAARDDGGVLHMYSRTDRPAATTQRNLIVGVVEAAPKADEGKLGDPDSGYRDLLDRHTYTHVEAQVMTITIDPAKKTASIDNRIYKASLGGKAYECLVQTGTVPIGADGTAVIDGKSLTSKTQTAAEAAPGWQKLEPELRRMYKLTSI